MAEAADPCNQTIGRGVSPLFSIALISGHSISAIKGVVVMHRMMNSVIFSAFLAGAAWVGPSPAVFAAVRDGNWSVLIITEKGECDRGYHYEVKVANGRVSYRGDFRHRPRRQCRTGWLDQGQHQGRRQGASGTGIVGPHRRRRLARGRSERQLRRPPGSGTGIAQRRPLAVADNRLEPRVSAAPAA